MKRTTMLAALAVLAAFGRVPLIHAEAPQECRRQCSLDFEACKNSCIDSRDFDGCGDECRWMYEDCLSGCR